MNAKLIAVILTTALTASGTTAFVMDSNTTTQPVDQYELDVRECMVHKLGIDVNQAAKTIMPKVVDISKLSIEDYVQAYGDELDKTRNAREKCETLIIIRNEAIAYMSGHK